MEKSVKVRKKPVVVDAWRWDGKTPIQDRPEWLQGLNVYSDLSEGVLSISTLEGTMIAVTGDWIIKGVAGEIYPCKPSIFDQTYEFVKE